MALSKDLEEKLTLLQEKYAAMGQDMKSYLDGLLHADYLTYWDYIGLDTLLSLQSPKTPFPDEYIFVTYHQITELYFKLCIQAIERILYENHLTEDFLVRQIKRLNRYFENLIQSFDIMIEGMDVEEFKTFRMSLLPASGFQSAQFRMIELYSTDLFHLVHPEKRDYITPDMPVPELYPLLYWKYGASELATGRKTLTLRQFEQKYSQQLIQLAEDMRGRNLRQRVQPFLQQVEHGSELHQLLREYDFNVNVRWALAHLRSAGRYLQSKEKVIEATGGTNWQKYLPPRFQRISFFPEIWTAEEREKWGRKTKL